MLIEPPFAPAIYTKHIWLKLEVQYHKQFGGVATYPNQNIPYAASIIIDLESRKVIKSIDKLCQDKLIDAPCIELIKLTAIPFDRNDHDWKRSLNPMFKSAMRDSVNLKRGTSEAFKDVVRHTISKGLYSTGLRGNVSATPLPDESCETC